MFNSIDKTVTILALTRDISARKAADETKKLVDLVYNNTS
jgi:hypothetical protein